MFSKNNDGPPSGQEKNPAVEGFLPAPDPGSPERLLCGSFHLSRRAIGELRFLLEGYDGLAGLRTLDAAHGLVELFWPASRHAEFTALLPELSAQLGLAPAAAGSDVRPW